MKHKFTLNNGGMTLVEVMVATTILAFIALTMSAGFLASSTLIRRGMDLQKAGTALAQQAEQMALDTSSISKIGVVFSSSGSKSTQINGKFVDVKDDKTGLIFTIFVVE